MVASSLMSLAADLASGRIRVVDLTQTLSPEFPPIALPPEFGQCLAVSHRGGLPLRRARSGLVLEQLLLRRAHRHAFRCADSLGVGPRLAAQRDGHHAGATFDRRRPASSTVRAKRRGCGLPVDRRPS